MTDNQIFFPIDLRDIYEYDRLTTYIPITTWISYNLEIDDASIFYVIIIFQIMKSNAYFILLIPE